MNLIKKLSFVLIFLIQFLLTPQASEVTNISKKMSLKDQNDAKIPDADEQGNIPTLNKYGFLYEDVFIDPFTADFLIYSTMEKRRILEVGAGFGHLSLEILRGGSHVLINDLEPRHLDLIRQRIPKSFLEKVEFHPGRFPNEVNIPSESLDGVFCRVLQFLSGKDVEQGLEKIMRWLKPGGRLYLIGPTIYIDSVPKKLRVAFHKKRIAGDPWPGMNFDPFDIYPKNIAYNLPDKIHLFDIDIILNALFKASFEILRIGYFDRFYRITGETTSGKQGFGVIAIKPGVAKEN